jgi:hypothetical protein
MHGLKKPGDIPKIRQTRYAQTVRISLRNITRLFSCGSLFPAKAGGVRESGG